MHIEVVLAMPEKQELIRLDVATDATVADAIEQSGIVAKFDGFELDEAKVGIFGQKVSMAQTLRDGDRVEIYRPLLADPKEVRRQRALKQTL
jgi:putative ubiquitin-RnfH superfamily antitoxin RatB of RatAB toxin-antitoxin module